MALTKKQLSDAKKVFAALQEDYGKDPKIEAGRMIKAQELMPIESPEDNLLKYQTSISSCLCPDKGYRGQRYYCKHQIKFFMLHPVEFFTERYLEGLW